QAELQDIASVVYRDARPGLLFPDGYVEKDGVAKINVVLSVDARPVRPEVRSIVGVWGQARGIGRLIYGEMRAGHFELRWDSPLLKTFFWGLGYEDLDGDGTKELIFRSDLAREGRIYSIFDLQGRELSRQTPCETEGVFDAKSGICPIVCDGIEIAPAAKSA